MTEDQAIKAASQRREFPETMEQLGRIRDALAAKLFTTPISAKDVREDIYTRVQAIDALTAEMSNILTTTASEPQIAAYVESLATTGK